MVEYLIRITVVTAAVLSAATALAQQTVRFFPRGYVPVGAVRFEPLNLFSEDKTVQDACRALQAGRLQEARIMFDKHLQTHPKDVVALTGYVQSFNMEEQMRLLSDLEKEARTKPSLVNRFKVGLTALYLWDQHLPAKPELLSKIRRFSIIAEENLPVVYQSLPHPVVALHLVKLYTMLVEPLRAIPVLEDQLRRLGGEGLYSMYEQAKRRKWRGVPDLPVPSHLTPRQTWVLSRVVKGLYTRYGIRGGSKSRPVDPDAEGYLVRFYDRLMDVLKQYPEFQ